MPRSFLAVLAVVRIDPRLAQFLERAENERDVMCRTYAMVKIIQPRPLCLALHYYGGMRTAYGTTRRAPRRACNDFASGMTLHPGPLPTTAVGVVMKIVKPGRPWWTSLGAACLECEAEFVLEASDRPVNSDRPPGSRLEHDQFRCPSCGALVLVINPDIGETAPPGLIVGV